MNEVTNFKYWLASLVLAFVFLLGGCVIFFSPLSGELKAAVVTFMLTSGTLVIQYYFRKAGSNEAGGESDIKPITTAPVTPVNSSPKADGAIGNQGSIQWTPKTVSSAAGTYEDSLDFEDVEPTDPGNATDKIINTIINALEDDGIEATDKSIPAHILSWYAYHADELKLADKKELLRVGIEMAKRAFGVAAQTAVVPSTYAEIARPQVWFLTHKKSCAVKDYGVVKPILMTLRDLLRKQSEL